MVPGTAVEPAQGGDPQSKMEVADLLVAYLEQLGVEYVFGVPGGAIEPLYNALARSERRGGPRAVVARHETGAAFMADGYARQTGKLAVCCATTGPGATNLITGVSSAYENNIPMLVITAQTSLTDFGRGAFQESSCTGINTVGMLQYCTRYNTFVSHVGQFERKLVAAVMSAYHSPAGPAHLSIPLDLFRGPAVNDKPFYDLANLLHRPSLLDDDAVAQLRKELENTRKAIFVIGEGCSESIGTILELAMMLGATLLTTPHGKGLVSPYHPLFRGVIGFAGHRSAVEALNDEAVDLVVAVGTGLGEWASDGWSSRLLDSRLVHVESTEGNLTRSPMAKLHVRGRIATIFEHLLEHFQKGPTRDRQEPDGAPARSPIVGSSPSLRPQFELDDEAAYNSQSTPIKPQRLMRELTRMFPPHTRYFADTGNSAAWAIHYLHPFDRRIAGQRDANAGLFRSCLEFASMGWAIGAAVGASLGSPKTPVVCITGDGSILMSGQELTVAVQEHLPLVFVVLNDGALGMVKHGQRLGGAEPIGFELPDVDYCAVAKAMGAEGHVICAPDDLLKLDAKAMWTRKGPTLLDVRIDPEEIPPLKTRMRILDIR
jgi:acetolactate synthase-1/2/3 large subunit